MSALLDAIEELGFDTRGIDKYETSDFADIVRPIETYRDDVMDYLNGGMEAKGVPLPWSKNFKLRPGELTIWAGENGDGKSLVVSVVTLWLAKFAQKSCVASFELHPRETILRKAAQLTGVEAEELTEIAVDDLIRFAKGKLFLYAEVGDIQPSRVLALCRYVRHELKIHHCVIDSLMKCGIDEKDLAGEKKFVNSLQNIAKQTGLHIHLVAHSKKPDGNGTSRYNVSGSAHISNLADNVIIVKRNRDKEICPELEKPDTWLHVDKQRHYTWEGFIGLDFHRCGQFTKRGGKLLAF